MKILRKTMLCCLIAAISLSVGGAASGNCTTAITSCFEHELCQNSRLSGECMRTDRLISYTGTITDIIKNEQIHRVCFVNESGNPESFNLNGNTFAPDTLVVGDKIIGYTYAWRPELMIYPPQHYADIILKLPENGFVYAGVFNEHLTSADNKLKLNVAGSTQIIDKGGNPVSQIPANNLLVVYYTITTRSIPPQTTPQKVIVLGKPLNSMQSLNHCCR